MPSIRKVGKGDMAAVYKIYSNPKVFEFFSTGRIPKKKFERLFEKKLARCELYCITVSGKISGIMGWKKVGKRHLARIVSVAVLPSQRRTGLATQLYFFVEEILKKKGMKKVDVFALENAKSAVSAYQKWGFRMAGKKRSTLKSGKHTDRIVLAKRLA